MSSCKTELIIDGKNKMIMFNDEDFVDHLLNLDKLMAMIRTSKAVDGICKYHAHYVASYVPILPPNLHDVVELLNLIL